MRKLTILFALLTLSVGLWAEENAEQNTLPTPAINQIIYRTSDHQKIGPYNPFAFVPDYNDDQNVYYAEGDYGVITFDGNLTTIGSRAFTGRTTLTAIEWPSTITSIEQEVFLGCTSLSSIDLYEGITSIGYGAFDRCSTLQSITLPASVDTIDEKAFVSCSSLTSVTVAWTEADKIPTIKANVFDKIANNQGLAGATLCVPVGTKTLYEAANVWNTFGKIADIAEVKAAAIAEIETAAIAAKVEVETASTYEAAKTTQRNCKINIDVVFAVAKVAINDATSKGVIDGLVLESTNEINYLKSEALTTIAKINKLEDAKAAAIAEITIARQGIQNTELNNWIDGAISDIQSAGTDTKGKVDNIKNQILPMIQLFQDGKAEGIEEGKAEAKTELLGEMAEPCTDCTAVKVTKGDKTVILYAPESVDYIVK